MKEKFEQLVKYLKETRGETKKVIWPNQRYIAVATTIIVVLSLITGLYIMGVDFIFTKIFGVLLK
ncbi:preprotein translocase subunit SecE [Candidatus Saganbacteria bacterium]|nr:preprotein translocase subunit SecE [Candidatus Saganbacteria bacterium]